MDAMQAPRERNDRIQLGMMMVYALALIACPAFAVQPDEVLPDPALEARAREISRNLRCPVCQGASVRTTTRPSTTRWTPAAVPIW